MKKTKNITDDGAIVAYSENSIQGIELDQFPDIIAESMDKIERIDSLRIKAEESAKKAEKKVQEAKKKAEVAKSTAIESVDYANAVEAKKNNVFHRKDVIAALQSGHVDLAESQSSIAEAMMEISEAEGKLATVQSDTMEALRLSFEFDKDIAQIAEYLFLLGCTSISASQTVCRQLEMRLEGASKKQISDLARAELMKVVRNLKAQESMMKRQEDVEGELDIVIGKVNTNAKKAKENRKRIEQLESNIEQLSDDLDDVDGFIQTVTESIDSFGHSITDLEEARRLGDQKDVEQDKAIEERIEKDLEHDLILQAQQDKDNEHDKAIEAGRVKDKEQDSIIESQREINELQEEQIIRLQSEVMKLQETTKYMNKSLRIKKRGSTKRYWR